MSSMKNLLRIESKHKVGMPVIYAVIGAFFMSLTSLCVKFLPEIPAIQILVIRSIVTITIIDFVVNYYQVDCYPTSKIVIIKLFARGIMGSVDATIWFMAIKLISLSEAIVLAKTVPLWTTLIAVFILHKEKLTIKSFFNILLCLLGVVLIARPPFIEQIFNDELIDSQIYQNHTLGVIFAIGSAILTSLIQVVINSLSGQVNQLAIIQYFSFLTIMNPVIYQLYSPFGDFKMPTIIEWVFLIGAGVTGCFGQLMMSRSFMLGELTQISLVNQSQVIFSFIFDIIIIHQSLNKISLLGTLLVMGSLVIVILRKKQQQSQQ